MTSLAPGSVVPLDVKYNVFGEGDLTLVVFPLIKELKSNPKEIAEKIGDYLVENSSVVSYNIVSGFLNLSIADEYYLSFFNSTKDNPRRTKTTGLYR